MMSKSTKKSNDTIVETFKDIIPLSFGEEIGNAASHGVAALLTLLVYPMRLCTVILHMVRLRL